MAAHPLAGADAAQTLDEGPPVRPGWNRRRNPVHDYDTYTFIDPENKAGETRFSRPPGVAVAEGRPYRPLAETEIWRITRQLAAQLDQPALLDRIEHAALTSRPMAGAFGKAYIVSVAAEKERLGQDWLAWAPRQVVTDYLSFAIPGVVAAISLGALLGTLVDTLCARAGETRRAPLVRAAVAAHYADMVYRLVRQRRGLNVMGYYQLSYLAEMYGYTVPLVMQGIQPQLTPDHLETLQRLLLNNEERSADQLAVFSNALPARYSTVGVLMYLARECRATGQSLAAAVDANRLHPALRAVFSAEAGAFTITVTEAGRTQTRLAAGETLDDIQARVHGRYIEATRALPAADLTELLAGEFDPLPERLLRIMQAPDTTACSQAIRDWQWPG
jgi:hypothetical protein